MCSRLGSELPIPLSVVSEQNLIHFLDSSTKDACSGDLECSSSDAPKSARKYDEIEIAYEKQLVNLINQMLDIDCTSNLVYIDHKSDERVRKHWRSLMEKKFCLLKPINHVSCLDDENTSLGPPQNTEEFNETFFKKLKKYSSPSSKFDLIIMKNCIQNFYEPGEIIKTLFDEHMIQSLDSGTVLVIQRSYQYNCLPFYDSLDKLWMQNDFSVSNFIDKLKVYKLDVSINIEEIDCNMSKMNWLLSLNNNQIYPLDYFNNKNLLSENIENSSNDGVRQICEGIFKYGSDAVTFSNKDKSETTSYGDEKNNYIFKDRLVFLTIKRSSMYFTLQKFKNRYLYEEKSKFRNIKHIQDTMSDYFQKEENKMTKKKEKEKENKNIKEFNQRKNTDGRCSVEDDVMGILFEIDPSLKNKVPFI